MRALAIHALERSKAKEGIKVYKSAVPFPRGWCVSHNFKAPFPVFLWEKNPAESHHHFLDLPLDELFCQSL
jgi:hypothetical protein